MNSKKCTVLPSKVKLLFNMLPDSEEIELLTELELSVNIQDINGEKIKDSDNAVINIEDESSGLNLSLTLLQLQWITRQAEILVIDSMDV